jgi:RNA polymerase sigma factor (sigma-70 family)
LLKKQIDINRQLVEESIKGSIKAQHQLYKLYADAMYYTCYNMMRNREEAEDMLQESFTDAFMKLDKFKFDSTFGTWLKRIVVNRCINEIKRKKTELEFTDNMETFEEKYIEEDKISTELSVEAIKAAMTQIPEGSRIVFQLYLLEGYDHREIAEILGVSESNSKSQYMVAKRKIKEILKDRLNEDR